MAKQRTADGSELSRMFVEDIRERMECIARCLHRLEEGLEGGEALVPEDLDELLREFHTVKACADFDGLSMLAEVIHAVEDLLGILRGARFKPGRAHLELLRTVVDFTALSISEPSPALEDLRRDADSVMAATYAAVDELNIWLGTRADSGEAEQDEAHVLFLSRSSDDLDALDAVRYEHAEVVGLIEWLDALRQAMSCMESHFSEETGRQAERAAALLEQIAGWGQPAPGKPLRELMEHLMSALRAASRWNRRPSGCDLGILSDVMTVIRNCYADLLQGGTGCLPGFGALMELVDEVRDQLRAGPSSPAHGSQAPDGDHMDLHDLGLRARKMVMKLAGDLGKEVRVEIRVEEGLRVNRDAGRRLDMMLIHLLRNALDHGVEAPEERERAGKSREGSIRVKMELREETLVLEVSDDGRGLCRETILAKARQKGMLKKGEESPDVVSVIMDAGFSTVSAPTLVSGRGTGLPVVREQVDVLGGVIEAESEEGDGICWRVRVPAAACGLIKAAKVGDHANSCV